MNNSISHPPHPRRAVPANLPPGAFFSYFLFFWIWGLSLFFSTVSPVFGDVNQSSDLPSYSEKIATLKVKSTAHARYVSELLSELEDLPQPLSQSTEFPDTSGDVSEKNDESDIFFPEQTSLTQGDNEYKNIVNDTPSEGSWEQGEKEVSSNYISPANDEVTYSSLYETKTQLRGTGSYLGPFFGLAFPSDSAVRTSTAHIDYKSNSGYFLGFRAGNDFGSSRIEGEYSFLNYGIDNASSSGEVSVHNISGRFLMEKEVGDRLDLRAGLGMGLTLIEKKFLSESFDGSGFSYDLLLGFSIRVMENWSILVDYRYFITAAHKNYDRLQSHLFELSANFDI